MVQLTPAEAREFYRVHEGKPFLDSLCRLHVERADRRRGRSRGRSDRAAGGDRRARPIPPKAAPGTIRRDFGIDLEKNSIHRSDAP